MATKAPKKKHHKRRRRKVSVESPLQHAGEVDVIDFVDPPRSSWTRFKRTLAMSWPVHDDSADGRRQAALWRLVFGGLALYLVTKGKTNIALAILGVTIAFSLVVIPMPRSRRRRWQDRLRAKTEPVERVRRVPAEVRFDGRKLVVRANDRSWKSLRPTSPRCKLVVQQDGTSLWLGLVPPGRGGDEGVWFSTDAQSVVETFDPLTPAELTGAAPTACFVDGAAWAHLHEVFHGLELSRS